MEELLKQLNRLEKTLSDLSHRLDDLERKLDALVSVDEDALDVLQGEHELSDELIHDALLVVVQYDRASSSLLQRRLAIGFKKAAKLLEHLEQEGVVGPPEGAKPREVLITNPDEYWRRRQQN